MSAKYKSPSFLLPNELNTSANTASDTGINSLYSMDFDGTQNIDCGDNSSLTPTNGISISFWIKTTDTTNSTGLIDKYNGATGDGYMIDISSTYLRFTIGLTTLSSTTSISDGNWHNVVCVCDNTNGYIYVDGSQVKTGSLTLSRISVVHNLYLMGDGVSSYKTTGQMDEVAIFNRALNTTEIAALYEGTGSNIRPSNLIATNLNPIAYYPLGEQAQNSGYLSASGNEWQFPNGVLQDYVMDFDGATVGDYIDAGDIPLEGVYTISFWINPDASPSSLYFLLDKGDGSSNISARVTQSSNNTIRFQIGSSNFSSTDTLTNNSWNNVILIANGSSSKIYINNGTAATGTLTTAPNTAQSLLIGTDEGKQSTYYFNGQMSNVVVWNTDQSANVANIYNNGSPQTTYTVTPQNWWKLNATSVYTPSAPNYTTALDFNGTSQITTSYTPPTGANARTISLWFYQDTSGNADICGYGTSSVASLFDIILNAGYVFVHGYGSYQEYGKGAYTVGAWNHYVITYDGAIAKGYVNNVATPENTVTLSTGTTNTFKIGNVPYNVGNFNGKISNVAVYNSALTPSQVSTLFNFGTPETNISFSPTAWWKLDNTTTGIQDSSGNGNNGTNNGASEVPSGVAVIPSWKIPTALTIPTINYTTALDFDSSQSDYINAGTAIGDLIGDNYAGSLSASLWFKRSSNTLGGLITFTTSGYGEFTALVYQDYVRFIINNGGYYIDHNSSTGYTYDTNWHHLAVVMTPNGSFTDIKMYFDGQLLTITPGGSSPTPDNLDFAGKKLLIGTFDLGTYFFDGQISNAAIFSSALTSSQVSTLFNSGQPESAISLSPVGWWKLDTGGSTITDYGSGGNNGANNGATQVTSDVYSGNIPVNGVSTTLPSTALQQSDLQFDSPYSNYSLYFDGSLDKITVDTSINSILPTGMNSFSFSIWFNVNSVDNSYNEFFGYGQPGVGLNGVRVYGGVFKHNSVNNPYGEDLNSTTVIQTGQWYHGAVTFDGTTRRIYVNGIEEASDTPTFTILPSDSYPLTIGVYPSRTKYTNGKLDETAIWNTALTGAQVLEIYNNGRPNDLSTFSGTTPIGWWRLGENAYFNDVPAFTVPNSIPGAGDGTGSGSTTSMISADAPGTYANGIGTNLDILDRVGDAALSTSNSQSYNIIPSDISPYVPSYVGKQIANNFSMTFDAASNTSFNAGQSLNIYGSQPRTISCWFNINSFATTSAGDGSNLLGYGTSTTLQAFSIAVTKYQNNPTHRIFLHVYSSTNDISGTTQILENNWYLATVTYDGSTLKLYLNGNLEGSSSTSSLNTATSDFIIGQGVFSTWNTLNGQIDEVAIFDTALNAGQIYNDIYQPTATGTNQTADLANNPNLPNPVAWYRMGD